MFPHLAKHPAPPPSPESKVLRAGPGTDINGVPLPGPPPEELNLFRGQILEYHVIDDKQRDAVRLTMRSDHRGSFRGVEAEGDSVDLQPTLLGYKIAHGASPFFARLIWTNCSASTVVDGG